MQTYAYDPLGRLTQEVQGDKVKQYGYDALGNRISENKRGIAQQYRYGKGNQLRKSANGLALV